MESQITTIPSNQEDLMDTSTLTTPSPDEIRAVLKKHNLTREQAASLLHVSLRTMHNWLAPVGTVNYRAMPLAAWELLLIKLGEKEVDRWIQ
ncbi:hypothetical protein SAMN05216404_1105 [Nitrosospira multiformis]|uniref:Uncharacterized protein n=1 Tax=Nitrosospira multiformis TaxID=1231 RepID=A0A1H8L7D6_9PROT|nr:hypothetical protein SAMN05216404_1105 [Nitrosospira multiformis]